MSFFDDFFARESDLNRNLTVEEYAGLIGFPNANYNNIGFLGRGYIKPSADNCYKYHCFMTSTILLYNATGYRVAAFEVSQSDTDLIDMVWEKCQSAKYKCVPLTHFGATYNCIGWAMGISKWLDPMEIKVLVQSGVNKSEAIKTFVESKSAEFPESHISNIDSILKRIDSFSTDLSNPVKNNTVAFYFNDKDECLHGARFVKTINNRQVEEWTSKLGSSISITHKLEDLTGELSIYGNILYYVGISNNSSLNDDYNDEL